jgi:hypothetical protein
MRLKLEDLLKFFLRLSILGENAKSHNSVWMIGTGNSMLEIILDKFQSTILAMEFSLKTSSKVKIKQKNLKNLTRFLVFYMQVWVTTECS